MAQKNDLPLAADRPGKSFPDKAPYSRPHRALPTIKVLATAQAQVVEPLHREGRKAPLPREGEIGADLAEKRGNTYDRREKTGMVLAQWTERNSNLRRIL